MHLDNIFQPIRKQRSKKPIDANLLIKNVDKKIEIFVEMKDRSITPYTPDQIFSISLWIISKKMPVCQICQSVGAKRHSRKTCDLFKDHFMVTHQEYHASQLATKTTG